MDSWAPWCGPCKLIAPLLDEVAGRYGDRLKVTKLDVDENPATAEQYSVRGIPTLLFIRDSKVVEKLVGAVPKSQLDMCIARLLDS